MLAFSSFFVVQAEKFIITFKF